MIFTEYYLRVMCVINLASYIAVNINKCAHVCVFMPVCEDMYMHMIEA